MTAAVVALSAVLAASSAGEDTYVQRVGDARVDWSQRTIAAEGRAAPPEGPVVAASWRKAEVEARLDARRKALVALRSLRVFGSTTVASLLGASPALAPELERVVGELTAVETSYEEGGAVRVVVRGGLDGRLLQALVPGAGRGSAPAKGGDEATTSVIVNARGIGAGVALAPRLYDEVGALLFDAGMLGPDGLARYGGAAYFRSLERATRDERAGGRPLIVKAVRATEPLGADLVIAATDATRLRRAVGALAEGRLLIVMD